jgi:DNA-binding MarR family transcriptional regulator
MEYQISQIGTLLKKLYKSYSNELLEKLQDRGFTDLRVSFLEVLNYVSRNDGVSIKLIGDGCGLKKQTMTSHLNELVKRGYLRREKGQNDRREQNIYLTSYGQQFRIALNECISELDEHYSQLVGSVELERLLSILRLTQQRLNS